MMFAALRRSLCSSQTQTGHRAAAAERCQHSREETRSECSNLDMKQKLFETIFTLKFLVNFTNKWQDILTFSHILCPSSFMTPFHVASERGHNDVLEVLQKHGAKVQASSHCMELIYYELCFRR